MPLFPAPISGDQSVVQVRRTTAFTLSGSFVDITFDTTDVENNADVIEHTDADRIKVKITGKYGISYALTAPIGTQTTSLQVRLNDITVLPGSERFSTSNSDAESISGSFIAELTADGYISLQAKSSSATPDIAAGITLSIIHLAGPKGDKGDASATDTDAIHKSTGAEISTLTEKSSPSVNDLLIIEDSDLTFIKKKLKVGNLPSGATLSDTPPVNITKAAAGQGAAAAASRQDHKHDISTATTSASAVIVGGSASEGELTTLARSDHLHAVTAAAPVSVGTANSAGDSGSFVHSNHVHSGLTRGSGDFNLFTGKVTPVGTDLLLIEDSDAANAKKKITISALPADSTAIHKATLAEISVITEKTTPVGADLLLIEDSAASYAKKRLQIGNVLNIVRETRDLIPAPEARMSGQGTKAALTTYDGASFVIRQAVSFNRIIFRISAKPTNGNAVVAIYQATNGLSGVATLVASATVSIAATGVIVSALNEGTILLSSGLCSILWGKTTGSFSFSVYTTTTISLLNDPTYVDTSTHSTTFTTTISTATFPATFNPFPPAGGGSATPSTTDTAIQIRMKTI